MKPIKRLTDCGDLTQFMPAISKVGYSNGPVPNPNPKSQP